MLAWRSPDAGHTERIYFDKINFWRDFFPGTGTLAENLGELVAPRSAAHIRRVRPE